MSKKRVCVLGAGSWGTALAHHLRRSNCEVVIWGRDPKVLQAISQKQSNPKYFPDIKLAPGLETEAKLEKAVEGSSLVVVAVPSIVVREVSKRFSPLVASDAIVVSTSKGLEDDTLKMMSEVLSEELGKEEQIAALSGPSFALEVIEGKPTAVTLAASSSQVAEEVCSYFHHDRFRVYTTADVKGVEFGGVLKNVMALAAGVVDGCSMGSNARAALLTRGLAEMQRLVVALGGEAMTVVGLSGLGDLLLTATGDLSRNRRVGLRLGKGEPLEKILEDLGQVAEGVLTAHKVLALAKRNGVDVPIIEEVNRIISGESTIEQSLKALFARPAGAEW